MKLKCQSLMTGCGCALLFLAVAGNAFARPVCLSAASDPDGDGFGWENSTTCIVAAAPQGLPDCLEASSDPDNDGFGWENNQSCRVPVASNSRAVCASSLSDPDGDGFGWENNQSCVVAAAEGLLAEEKQTLSVPECSDQRFASGNGNFGWENSRSCTFGHAGDNGSSITDIVVVTGQSNALGAETGRMDPLSFDAGLDSPVKRAYVYSKNGWGIAGLRQIWDLGWYPRGDIMATPANNFAFHFAKRLVREDADRVVGIIVITAPGAAISHWDADGDFFAQIDNKVLAALSQLPGRPTVRGILWHQGETDYHNTDYYRGKLNNLIANFRTRSWFNNDALFICGETLNAPVNGQLNRLNSDGDTRTGCVAAEDLQSVGDDVHFDAASLRELGSRYAQKYLQLLAQ